LDKHTSYCFTHECQEASTELWQHNKPSKPWMSLVKNLRKNGDHFGTNAFISPIYKDSIIVAIGETETQSKINP
jgi:hypothetical protein